MVLSSSAVRSFQGERRISQPDSCQVGRHRGAMMLIAARLTAASLEEVGRSVPPGCGVLQLLVFVPLVSRSADHQLDQHRRIHGRTRQVVLVLWLGKSLAEMGSPQLSARAAEPLIPGIAIVLVVLGGDVSTAIILLRSCSAALFSPGQPAPSCHPAGGDADRRRGDRPRSVRTRASRIAATLEVARPTVTFFGLCYQTVHGWWARRRRWNLRRGTRQFEGQVVADTGNGFHLRDHRRELRMVRSWCWCCCWCSRSPSVRDHPWTPLHRRLRAGRRGAVLVWIIAR
jgi:hypothetical protein